MEAKKEIKFGANLILTPGAEGMAGATKRATELQVLDFAFVDRIEQVSNEEAI